MRNYLAAALAFLLAASMLTACRNVSDDPGGRITEPTKAVRPVDPMPTMTIPPAELPTTRPTEMTLPAEELLPSLLPTESADSSAQ